MLRICPSLASMLVNPKHQFTDFHSNGQSRLCLHLGELSLPGFWDPKLTWVSSFLTSYTFSVSFAGSSSSLQPLSIRGPRDPLSPFSFVFTSFLTLKNSQAEGILQCSDDPDLGRGGRVSSQDSLGMEEGMRLKVKVTQSCPTLCDPWTSQSVEFSSPKY